jgi:hypothetical protein
MAYVPTTFVDRSVEFPNRRKFTAVSGLADTFDVARAEGTVFAEGTKPDAENLNAEFGKIKTEIDAISSVCEISPMLPNVEANHISKSLHHVSIEILAYRNGGDTLWTNGQYTYPIATIPTNYRPVRDIVRYPCCIRNTQSGAASEIAFIDVNHISGDITIDASTPIATGMNEIDLYLNYSI